MYVCMLCESQCVQGGVRGVQQRESVRVYSYACAVRFSLGQLHQELREEKRRFKELNHK